MKKSKYIETEVIHGSYNPKSSKGSLTPPIYQTSTFTFESAEQGAARFAGEEQGYIYSRLGNPTVTYLEERVAQLEEGEACLAFSSGMAAVSAILIGLTKSEDHILCSQGIYGCTFGLLELLQEKYNVNYEFSEMINEEQIRSQIRPETTCIYIETPINPTMKLVDLKMVSKVAKEYDITVVVDNTFCSPYLQKPLTLGCDIVIHSATKYLGGHGDLIAGLAVGKKDFINRIKMTTQKDIGGVLAPFDAWLLMRGIKTLPIRMDRHCENAAVLADKLNQHSNIKEIYYPGDINHPQYNLAKNQMRQFGGLISFELKGTKEDAQTFLNHLNLIQIAVSLGDAETLIQHPASMTHSVVPKESREKMGISETLIRLSVGLEKWEDIWDDLQQALDSI